MDGFILKLMLCTHKRILSLSKTRDYLAYNLNYLDKLNSNNDYYGIKSTLLTNIDTIHYMNNDATNLEWLKYFPNVKYLNCSFNHLDSSSLESLKYVLKLERLLIRNNNITSIDISSYTSLEHLDLNNNYVTQLSAQRVLILRNLTCKNNQLTNLDIINCKNLKLLSCEKNKLSELNLQGLKKLWHVNCNSNQLTKINLSDTRHLSMLCCNDNQLTSLNLSNSPNLQYLYCKKNKILNIKEACKHLKLNKFEYDIISSFSSYHGQDVCCICLESLNLEILKSSNKIITDCRHVFHDTCLTTWINKYAYTPNCPYCRQMI